MLFTSGWDAVISRVASSILSNSGFILQLLEHLGSVRSPAGELSMPAKPAKQALRLRTDSIDSISAYHYRYAQVACYRQVLPLMDPTSSKKVLRSLTNSPTGVMSEPMPHEMIIIMAEM